MVAMSGRIIPEPLTIPVTVSVCPATSKCRDMHLGTVSVVMMARAAAAQPFSSRSRDGAVDGFGKARHWHAFTDDAGGKGQHRVCGASAALGDCLATATCIRQPPGACSGIGITGIDKQIARRLAAEVFTGNNHRRGTERIAGKHRCRAASGGQFNNGQIVSGIAAHTQGRATEAHACNRIRVDLPAQSNGHEALPWKPAIGRAIQTNRFFSSHVRDIVYIFCPTRKDRVRCGRLFGPGV